MPPPSAPIIDVSAAMSNSSPLPSLPLAYAPSPLIDVMASASSCVPQITTGAYGAMLSYLSPACLFAFGDFLKTSALAAHTSRKGLSCLMSALRKLCGGRGLSAVDMQTKFAARETIGALQDLITSLNRASARAINATEGRKLMGLAERPRAEKYLIALYLLADICKYWFWSKVNGDLDTLSLHDLHCLSGYIIFRAQLARVVTRTEALKKITLEQVASQLLAAQEYISLVLDQHKSMASYGALFLLWESNYISNEMALYITKLRPALMAVSSVWGRTKKTQLFSERADRHAAVFLRDLGKLPNLSLAQIRKLACDYLASLPNNDDSNDIRLAAAHEASMSTKHYCYSSKISRDQKLCQLVRREFVTPAQQRVLSIAHPAILPDCRCVLPQDYKSGSASLAPLARSPRAAAGGPSASKSTQDSGGLASSNSEPAFRANSEPALLASSSNSEPASAGSDQDSPPAPAPTKKKRKANVLTRTCLNKKHKKRYVSVSVCVCVFVCLCVCVRVCV